MAGGRGAVRYQARHLLFVYGADDFSVAITGRAGHRLPGILVVGTGLDGIDHMIGRLALTDLAVGGVVIALLAGLGAAVIRASLRPLSEIGESARAVAAGELSRWVPDRGPGSVINGFAEYYRQRGPLGAGELDRMMRRVEDEAAWLGAMVSALGMAAAALHDRHSAGTPSRYGADNRSERSRRLQG